MIKHNFFENLGKIANLGGTESENLNAEFLIGKALFLTLFKGTENRFSISCLV